MSNSNVRTHWRRADVSECEGPINKELPDAATIRLAQQGDGAAFERIYQLHSPRVYALCLRMIGNPAEAEDLMQEAFLRVFRKIRTFRGESAFSTWLHRLAFNIVLMQLRRKKLSGTPLEEISRPNKESTGLYNEVGGPDVSLTWLIDRVNLERAVERLPLTQKSVFMLHDIQGYKHHEIAEMMDCSIGTSKGQLHRARMRLRKILQESKRYLGLASGTSGQSIRCSSSY